MSTTQRGVSVTLFLAVCIVSGSGQGLPQPHVPAFPALPRPGSNGAGFQSLAPSSADAAGMAPSYEDAQSGGMAPAPIGTGQPYRPGAGAGAAPQRAPGPLSPYNPIFNPIISKTDPSTAAANMQAQTQGYSAYQTVTANNNGQVSTTPTNYAGNSGASGTGQYSSNTQQNGNQISSTYGQGGNAYNAQQGGGNTAYGTQNNQMGYPMMAPAPAPVQIGTTNAMVQRVDTAYKKAQTTPQLSFGADGMTIQQPVVDHPDGIVSGGNQFKVNDKGVILGNVGTGGSIDMQNNGGVTIDPGTAGNLWNLARSAAQLYGRKLQEHTE